MFRRMIQAYRHTGTQRTSTRARWRPMLEHLESRLVPSAASFLAHPEPAPAIFQAAPFGASVIDSAPTVSQSRNEGFLVVPSVAVHAPAALDAPAATGAAEAEAVARSAAPAHGDLPLVAWVSGMTGLLMLRWEDRKGRTVALAAAGT